MIDVLPFSFLPFFLSFFSGFPVSPLYQYFHDYFDFSTCSHREALELFVRGNLVPEVMERPSMDVFFSTRLEA